ncbi:MAG: hypothetical protein ACM3XZ_05115 [Betaproteobacteria bacterium]
MAMCEDHIRLSNNVAALDARVENLEQYKEKQNGSLQRLADQVDEIRRSITGLLGGLVVSLILLVANLVVTFSMRR